MVTGPVRERIEMPLRKIKAAELTHDENSFAIRQAEIFCNKREDNSDIPWTMQDITTFKEGFALGVGFARGEKVRVDLPDIDFKWPVIRIPFNHIAIRNVEGTLELEFHRDRETAITLALPPLSPGNQWTLDDVHGVVLAKLSVS